MAIGEHFYCDVTDPEIDCNSEYKIYKQEIGGEQLHKFLKLTSNKKTKVPPKLSLAEEKAIQRILAAYVVPIILIVSISTIFGVSGRFILSNFVADKESKMKDSLKIMNMSQVSYSMSYLLV